MSNAIKPSDWLPEADEGTGKFTVYEIRFIPGAEFSEVLVYVHTTGAIPKDIDPTGWHKKQFPTSMAFKDIYDEMCRSDNPLMWPRCEVVPMMLTKTELERIAI